VANVLSEYKQDLIVSLGRLGWSARRIAGEVGAHRETVVGYLKAAGVPMRPPGHWGRHPPKPAIEVTPPRARQQSHCEPHREAIETKLAAGQNAKVIWQDLVTDHGFGSSYESVKRFVRGLRGPRRPPQRAVIETPPGEEAQVDYGDGPLVRHPSSGRYLRPRLFALTLGWSRKSVWLLSWKSSAEIWARLHERAFRRLGAAPRVLVLDNLKEGVAAVDYLDPELNPTFRAVLRHYGVAGLPCRVRDPDRKGKVESAVDYAQTSFAGKRFETIDEAQAAIDEWDERWASARVHGTTRRCVNQAFDEERSALLPLPAEPFRYFKHGRRRVDAHGRVEVDVAFYDVPPGRIGEWLDVQWDDRVVRILEPTTGTLLVEQPKQAQRIQQRPPPSKPSRAEELCARADKAGEAIGLVAHRIATDTEPAEMAARRIRALLDLAKKYGAEHIDEVCRFALDAGSPTYRFIKSYLDHRPPAQLTLRQVDPLIRELNAYRDVVAKLTTQEDQS